MVHRASPTVSIITATFNRSNVLRYAIESVLHSTFDEWEMIVVGDCCTDDSDQVVRSFADDRIRWHNLPENHGEQSKPNNVGLDLSRGQYVGYLNHDDMYFPDHLETSLEWLQTSNADLVFSALAVVLPSTPRERRNNQWRCDIRAVSPTGVYEHYVGCPASSWIARRQAMERFRWPDARNCFDASSQNVLTAMHRDGLKLVGKPQVTVLAIHSGGRSNVYAQREFEENEYYWKRMCVDPSFREDLLGRVAVDLSARKHVFRWREWGRLLVSRTLARLGLRPMRMWYRLRYGRRGEFINRLRRQRGLAPLPKEKH